MQLNNTCSLVAFNAVFFKAENNSQFSVYYVSKLIATTKTRYLEIDKHIYAVIVAREKLLPYIIVHTITVLPTIPLSNSYKSLIPRKNGKVGG